MLLVLIAPIRHEFLVGCKEFAGVCIFWRLFRRYFRVLNYLIHNVFGVWP